MPSNSSMIHDLKSFNVFPSDIFKDDDRIWNQMRYVPPHLLGHQLNVKKKIILFYNGLGDTKNTDLEVCPVHRCEVTVNRTFAKNADVIIWMNSLQGTIPKKPQGQIWALFSLESPMYSGSLFPYLEANINTQINWTATYRRDSTIVTPYFKYTPFDLINPPPNRYPLPKKNYAFGKTKMVAWFISNCLSENRRMDVAKNIKQYTQVDIYGLCGLLRCPKYKSKDCFDMLNREYKFYLSFENSNCEGYITEKFFLNGLSNDVIPVVMGARPDNYRRVAPPHSFIHVEDFETIKDLVNYMKYLDRNDTAYNEYFSWKGFGTVNTNTFFVCRLCMMAHEGDRVTSVYTNAYKWWMEVCIGPGLWKNQKKFGSSK